MATFNVSAPIHVSHYTPTPIENKTVVEIKRVFGKITKIEDLITAVKEKLCNKNVRPWVIVSEVERCISRGREAICRQVFADIYGAVPPSVASSQQCYGGAQHTGNPLYREDYREDDIDYSNQFDKDSQTPVSGYAVVHPAPDNAPEPVLDPNPISARGVKTNTEASQWPT